MISSLNNKMYQELSEQPVIDPIVLDKENCTINSYLKSNLRVNNRFGIEPHTYYVSYMNIYDHTRCRRIKSSYGNFNVAFTFPYSNVDKLVHDMFQSEIDDDFYIFICNPKLYKYKSPNTVSIANVAKKDFRLNSVVFRKIQMVNRSYYNAVGEPLFFMPYSEDYVPELTKYYSFVDD